MCSKAFRWNTFSDKIQPINSGDIRISRLVVQGWTEGAIFGLKAKPKPKVKKLPGGGGGIAINLYTPFGIDFNLLMLLSFSSGQWMQPLNHRWL